MNEGDWTDLTRWKAGDPLDFSYTVTFIPETLEKHKDTDIVADEGTVADNEVHWVAIGVSFMTVMMAVAIVYLITGNVVRRDVNTVNDPEQIDFGANRVGWKLIRLEVFQIPLQRNLLCAAVGSGMQLLMLIFILIALGCIGLYAGNQGSVRVSAILLYAFTAGKINAHIMSCCLAVSGYTSARLYKYLGGKHWAFNLILVSILYPAPFLAVWSILNNFAWAKGSSAALPIGTILVLLVMWLLISFPLTVVGGITGRLRFSDSLFEESRIQKIQKPIPDKPWYLQLIPSILITGIIPFL
jgi:hypothetical protein